MKKPLLLFFLAALLFTSCSKSKDAATSNPTAVPQPVKFEITDIKSASNKIIVGQRSTFTSALTDSSGNINYEWKIYFNGVQMGSTLSGLTVKSVNLNTTAVGEYTLSLTITRGATDKSTISKKFISYAANFQYGVWGDTEATIKTAEADNHNTLDLALVGIPYVVPSNTGLTTITYTKSGKYYTYYFKAGKLYAGAYTVVYPYVNQNTNLAAAYTLYYTEKTNLEKALAITMTDQKTWTITDQSQITHWDISNTTRAQAIGLNYLKLTSDGSGTLGKASLTLYKNTATIVNFSYVIVSPN